MSREKFGLTEYAERISSAERRIVGLMKIHSSPIIILARAFVARISSVAAETDQRPGGDGGRARGR